MNSYFPTIFKFISRKLKLRLFWLFLLMILSSISEVISIASLIPFINVATNPNQEFKEFPLSGIISNLTINQSNFLIIYGLIFIIAIVWHITLSV